MTRKREICVTIKWNTVDLSYFSNSCTLLGARAEYHTPFRKHCEIEQARADHAELSKLLFSFKLGIFSTYSTLIEASLSTEAS